MARKCSFFFYYFCISTSLFFLLHHAQALVEQTKPIYGSHQLITYVVDWDLPKWIPWSKVDHIAYAFAVPDQDGELTLFDQAQLNKVVEDAHNHGKGVSLAIGGWTGSIHFSNLVRTTQSRKKFASILADAVEKYNLNGLNIDWEYPNDPNGVSCNQKHPRDTDNFLALIKLLRQMLDEKYPEERKLLIAAVSTNVFKDQDRHSFERLEDGWSVDMDAFYIMAYDINGVWSNTTSANAPLYIGDSGEHISANSSIQSWMDAGIPSDRIYLGVPFYGYTHKTLQNMSRETGLNTPLDRSIKQIKGDKYDDLAKDPCPDSIASYSGEFQWRSIEASGAAYNASDWATYWDQKTSTPYAYNSQKHQFITFDNPDSLRVKTAYVKEHKLGGIMVWSLEMDDYSNSLLNAIQDVRT